MNEHTQPTDAGWTEDKVLMADLSKLNHDLTRYILRYLDADAGRKEPISTRDEDAFGERLMDLGERVQQRATRRGLQIRRKARPAIEGDAAHPRAFEPGQGSDMDHGP